MRFFLYAQLIEKGRRQDRITKLINRGLNIHRISPRIDQSLVRQKNNVFPSRHESKDKQQFFFQNIEGHHRNANPNRKKYACRSIKIQLIRPFQNKKKATTPNPHFPKSGAINAPEQVLTIIATQNQTDQIRTTWAREQCPNSLTLDPYRRTPLIYIDPMVIDRSRRGKTLFRNTKENSGTEEGGERISVFVFPFGVATSIRKQISRKQSRREGQKRISRNYLKLDKVGNF